MPGFADRFIHALRQLEEGEDAGPIAALFGPDATISNPLVAHEGGEEAAARFWTSYRGTFRTIRSEFRHVVDEDGLSLMEWVSEGETSGGPFRYGGVSVVEHDGERIAAFRTYFDPTQVRPPAR
jgi:limonene-1,2-epoxide hydrolase